MRNKFTSKTARNAAAISWSGKRVARGKPFNRKRAREAGRKMTAKKLAAISANLKLAAQRAEEKRRQEFIKTFHSV